MKYIYGLFIEKDKFELMIQAICKKELIAIFARSDEEVKLWKRMNACSIKNYLCSQAYLPRIDIDE